MENGITIGTFFLAAGLIQIPLVFGFSQTQHADLTQIGSVLCQSNGTYHKMFFYLDTANDTVDAVYTVVSPDGTPSNFSTLVNPSPIEGNGTTDFPFQFFISAEGNLTGGLTLQQNAIDAYAKLTDDDVMSVDVMSKSVYKAPFFEKGIFAKDVLYTSSCNFSESGDLTLSSGKLTVQGDINEKANVVQDSATMSVFDETSTNQLIVVALNTPIVLGVQATLPTRAHGIYVHSCQLCEVKDCAGLISIQFVDSNGCGVGSYISPFYSGNSSLELYTRSFSAFTLSTGPDVFFQCKVNFCYEPNSPACQDYCAHNNGRKKRDVAAAQKRDVIFSTSIEVIDLRPVNLEPDVELNLGNKEHIDVPSKMADTDNTGLIVLVVVCSVITVIFLVLAAVLWFKFCSSLRQTPTKS